jgi:hypothetical protein
MYRGSRKFINFFQSKSVRTFESRDKVYEYLEQEVFIKLPFSNHISETAKTLEISYLLAYEIITNYLTDILYEVDIAVSDRKKRKRISIHAYFFLEIGFMVSVKNKKMYLEQIIK